MDTGEFWTSAKIKELYRFEDRGKSLQSLYNGEEKGEIPKAARVSRGKLKVRQWTLEQLPEIGKKFGFLKNKNHQIIINKYIQKGGVLKTTTSFNEARIFAINGMKTLVIGQDFECSITDIILPKPEINNISEISAKKGLFDCFVNNVHIKNVICKTTIPTLDIIPETHSLVLFDKWISQQKRREYIYREKLIPQLKEYDVIIFDNGPSWNHLIENSITASNVILCPLGCNLLAYNATETNLASLFEFFEEMHKKDHILIMFPTLLDRNSISQQIYAQYVVRFSKYLIPIPIKVSAKFQEALVKAQSILEYLPNSQPANEYYELIQQIWERIPNLQK